MVISPPDEGSTSTLEIGLLGPVTASVEGTPLALGSRLQRGVLAVLALSPGALVPSARLSEALWGDAPPATAAGTLRAYVSRLRTVVGADHLPRVDGGYRLAVDAAAVDASCFAQDLVAARDLVTTDPPRARLVLDRALGWWRGDALADVTGLPFAAGAAERLREQLREAENLRWRVRLALGEHRQALDELAAAVGVTPEDEQVVAMLMIALYREGRQTEALHRFADLREHLVDELGIDPGPEVRRVHQAILAQDPSLLTGDPVLGPDVPVVADAGGNGSQVGATAGAATTPAAAPAPPAVAGDHPAPPVAAGNLPTPLTSFVGRAPQLEVLDRLLASARLLTLTGVGGVGKTRLAIEAVRRAGGRSDGPWLVELAGLTDPATVQTAVVQALGLAAAGVNPLDAVVASLRGRSTILLLDNCEHLLDAVAPLAAALLAQCPQLRVVATSREPLGVPGEQILVIPSLPAGSSDDAGDAAVLFAERAALVDPSFVLDDRTRPQVQAVCRALDGIPLAIELAAARLSALSLDQVADLLADRFALLSDGSRVAVPRHRTLAAAIDWSYDPLPADERAVLHAAATFSGGFGLEALAAVADVGLTEAARLLSALVDKSMVTTVDARAGRRFRVLETIRQYCRRQLGEEGWVALADRHAAWAATVAREVADRYLGEALPWDLVVAERDNLRAALAHCDATGDVATGLRICGDLSWSWFRLGQVIEGNRWLDRFIAAADGTELADRAQAHIGRALGAYLSGDLPTAQTSIVAAVEDATAAEDPVQQSLAVVYLAYFEGAFGRVDVADQLLDEAEAREVPEWVLAEIDMVRGQVRRAQGRVDEAIAVLERSRERAARWHHSYIWGSSGWIMAKTMLDAGRHEAAGPLLAEVIQRLAVQGDRSSTLATMHTMGGIAAALGRLYEGAMLLGAVDVLGERIGYHPLRMDPLDAPRQRALVTDALPAPVLDKALAEGGAMGLRQAVSLAVQVGQIPGRPTAAAGRAAG